MSDKISDKLIEKIKIDDGKFFGNDNISEYIEDGDLELLLEEVAGNVDQLLRSLVIDVDNDHNSQGTAKRVAKMLLNETYKGRYQGKPRITSFPNAENFDQLYITGPITVRSQCSHHMQNIVGKCWIGIFPGEKVIGLSKFNRIVDWVASRPQIQEEMTVQIADAIEKETEALGIAVILKAEHMCMTHRGVKEHDSDMTTSIMRGVFREEEKLKSEFLSLLSGMKGF